MVIYQKQHRLPHRQYCVPLSESRLTRFPPPSKKAFFPSSHIFHVNSKRIIKTLFSSKYSSINFRDSLHLKGRQGGMKRPRHRSVLQRKRLCSRGVELRPLSRTSLQGQHCSAPSAAPKLCSALGHPNRALIQPSQREQSRGDIPAGDPRRSLGGEALSASQHPNFEG